MSDTHLTLTLRETNLIVVALWFLAQNKEVRDEAINTQLKVLDQWDKQNTKEAGRA